MRRGYKTEFVVVGRWRVVCCTNQMFRHNLFVAVSTFEFRWNRAVIKRSVDSSSSPLSCAHSVSGKIKIRRCLIPREWSSKNYILARIIFGCRKKCEHVKPMSIHRGRLRKIADVVNLYFFKNYDLKKNLWKYLAEKSLQNFFV
jgi:hypothetical protein